MNLEFNLKKNMQVVFAYSNRKILFFGGIVILLIAWFSLGIYLHQQVRESRAKVAQSRIEAQRREERLRRGAQYKYDLQERTRTPQTRNAFDGR